MNKFILICFVLLGFQVNSQTRYSTYGKTTNGKYTYTKVANDPTGARWYVLPNGLTVILSVNKEQPRVQTLIAVKAGSKNDPADNTGLAHYLEHLLFKGTDQYGTQDYAKESIYLKQIDQLYEKYNQTKDEKLRTSIYRQIDSISSIASQFSIANEYDKVCQSIGAQGTNAFTSVEQTVYVNNIPSNRIHQWVQLEAERYRQPVFRLFHTELEAVYEEKNISLDNDMSKVYEGLFASLFRQHPYGTQTTIGTVDHLKNPSLVKIREYYNTYYVPNNMAIIMVGDFNPDELIEMIDEHFSYMKPSTVPEFKSPIEYPRGRPDSISITGPDEASLVMGWRFDGISSREALMVRVIDLLLSNSKAGLIDLNLVKQQKALNAGCSPEFMKDYSVHLFYGSPKQGQSLEELRELLLSQIEKIKKGEFDDELLKGIITNNMVDEIKKYEQYESVAYSLLDAFVTDRKWIDVLNDNFKMSIVTKQEIMDFANEYYNNGYTVIYKRTGEKPKIAKIEKPAITEVALNRDKTSLFVNDLLSEEADSMLPVFVNYQQNLQKENIAGLDFYYKKNEDNQLFTLYYVLDMGRFNNKKMPLAIEYLQYIGTDQYKADEISKKFYQLACNYGVSAGDKRSYIYLSGPQQNFKEALTLFEHLLSNAKGDNQALKDYIASIKKSREDEKLNKRAIASALSTYALYGKNNPRTYLLNNAELNALTATELISIIKSLNQYKHHIFYYGPEEKTMATQTITQLHVVPKQFLVIPPAIVFKPQVQTKNMVYFTHYEMVQAEINWRSSLGEFNINQIPAIKAFNEYFGGGMSSVVFQEIRESRALAYSTYAYYNQSMEKGKNDLLIAYVGTQADKLHDAIKTMNGLLSNMPENEESFNQAKASILSSIEAERINKTNLFFRYLSAIDMGIDYDYRKMVYESIQKMTFNDIKQLHEQAVKNAKWSMAVVGSKDKIKEADLRQYGEFKSLTLEEIFGY
jgi:predicted Zn-dependent peptidase